MSIRIHIHQIRTDRSARSNVGSVHCRHRTRAGGVILLVIPKTAIDVNYSVHGYIQHHADVPALNLSRYLVQMEGRVHLHTAS
jgi:hypothetical protein